ncbi:hypothetical protein JYG30_19690 [Fibrella sp. USSR17]
MKGTIKIIFGWFLLILGALLLVTGAKQIFQTFLVIIVLLTNGGDGETYAQVTGTFVGQGLIIALAFFFVKKGMKLKDSPKSQRSV